MDGDNIAGNILNSGLEMSRPTLAVHETGDATYSSVTREQAYAHARRIFSAVSAWKIGGDVDKAQLVTDVLAVTHFGADWYRSRRLFGLMHDESDLVLSSMVGLLQSSAQMASSDPGSLWTLEGGRPLVQRSEVFIIALKALLKWLADSFDIQDIIDYILQGSSRDA